MHLWVMWRIWRSWCWFLNMHTNKASNEYLWISCDPPKSLKAKKTKKAFFFLGRVTVFSLVFMLQFTSLGMCTYVHLLLYFARGKPWVVIIIILLSLLYIYIYIFGLSICNGSSSKISKNPRIRDVKELHIRPLGNNHTAQDVIWTSYSPNSNLESTGIKLFCWKIAFNKYKYHKVTNHLTRITD